MAYMFGGATAGQHGQKVGVMKVFSTGTPAWLTLQMGGWTAGASTQNAVISGVSANTAGNYQFLLTMRNYTYVYVFGEKMGDVVVSGIAAVECGDGPMYPSTSPVGRHGLYSAIAYYNTYRLGQTGAPVALSLAGVATFAFLVGGTFQHMDPKSMLAKFQFRFKTIVDPS